MPTIVPESSSEQFLPTDWLELLDSADPGGADVMSIENSEATLVGMIPANKVRSAMAFLLGYSYADAGYPYKLHRIPPARHPVFPWLYVNAVQLHRHYPVGNNLNALNAPSVSAVDPYKLTKTGRYHKAWATLHFAPKPYDLFEDADPTFNGPIYQGVEVYRFANVYKTTEPNLETISASTGKYLRFIEGPPSGKDFPGDITEYKISTNLVIAWDNVPADFIYDSTGYAAKIIPGIGCVNRQTFLGNPPGTLLLYPPKLPKHIQPIRTTTGQAQFGINVEFNIGLFDPKPGLGYGNSYYRGWNLMPWVENPGTGQSGGVGWYSAKRKDSQGVSTGAFLPDYPFVDLFKHWAAP